MTPSSLILHKVYDTLPFFKRRDWSPCLTYHYHALVTSLLSNPWHSTKSLKWNCANFSKIGFRKKCVKFLIQDKKKTVEGKAWKNWFSRYHINWLRDLTSKGISWFQICGLHIHVRLSKIKVSLKFCRNRNPSVRKWFDRHGWVNLRQTFSSKAISRDTTQKMNYWGDFATPIYCDFYWAQQPIRLKRNGQVEAISVT